MFLSNAAMGGHGTSLAFGMRYSNSLSGGGRVLSFGMGMSRGLGCDADAQVALMVLGSEAHAKKTFSHSADGCHMPVSHAT